MEIRVMYKKRIIRSIKKSEKYLQTLLQMRSQHNQALNPIFSLSDQLHQHVGIYTRQTLLEVLHFEQFLKQYVKASGQNKDLPLLDYYSISKNNYSKEKSLMRLFQKRNQKPNTEAMILESMERIQNLEITIKRLFQQAKKTNDKESIAFRTLSSQYAIAKKELASELNIVERLITSKEQVITNDILKRRNYFSEMLDTLFLASFEQAETLWEQIQEKELAFDTKQEQFNQLNQQLQQTPFNAKDDPLSKDLENAVFESSEDNSEDSVSLIKSTKAR